MFSSSYYLWFSAIKYRRKSRRYFHCHIKYTCCQKKYLILISTHFFFSFWQVLSKNRMSNSGSVKARGKKCNSIVADGDKSTETFQESHKRIVRMFHFFRFFKNERCMKKVFFCLFFSAFNTSLTDLALLVFIIVAQFGFCVCRWRK